MAAAGLVVVTSTGAGAQSSFICTKNDSTLSWSGVPGWATAQDVIQDGRTVKYLGKAARSWPEAISATSTYAITAKRGTQSVSATCDDGANNSSGNNGGATPNDDADETRGPSVMPPSRTGQLFQQRMVQSLVAPMGRRGNALAAGLLVGGLTRSSLWSTQHYACYHTVAQMEQYGWRIKTS